MFIACRTCSASYHIPDEILGDHACQFRCARCGRSWELAPRQTLAGSLASDGDVARPHPPVGRARKGAGFGAGARRVAASLACGAALGCAMGAVGAREAIVRALPATARFYQAIGLPVNLTGLSIVEVSAHLGQGADKTLLAVEGSLVNLRQRETAAPDLRIALRGADGRELYVWTTRPPKDRLAAGERAPFVARLAAPPPGVVDALVKFVAPGDKLALGPEGS
jgi:predicted Zn finger-like uncharacterized protein